MGVHEPVQKSVSLARPADLEPTPFEPPDAFGGAVAGVLSIASQLGDGAHTVFAEAFPKVNFIRVRQGTLAGSLFGAQVLIAAPFRSPGGALPTAPPPGWPNRVKWVQLIPCGLDLYPRWLFDGPVVTTAGPAPALALAEFALAAIYADAKSLPDAWVDRIESWSPAPVRMVAGSTLGIVGYGAVGRTLALQAQALGLNVLVHRRSKTPITDRGVQRVRDLETVLSRSDHLVIAAPATPETERILDDEALAHAKPGLHLINIAFGDVVDDPALLRAIEDGRVRRATLDVASAEPMLFNHPFYRHPRVRLSARTAINTPVIWRNLADQFAQNLIRYRAGMPLANVVKPRRGY